MLHVVFACPFFNDTANRYIEAATSVAGVRLGVISQAVFEDLPPHLQARIAGHWRVDDVLDSGQIAHAAWSLSQRLGPVHRLFSGQEQLQVPIAQAREWLNIPGMRVEAALNFRDKARMKSVLRAAGLPCAHHDVVTDAEDAWRFAQGCGFPLILKPLQGAGSAATFRVDSVEDMVNALAQAQPGSDNPLLVEEFITGHEHSFETFSLRGRPLWHSLTHYHPSPLEVLNNPWIQWTVVLPREVDEPQYHDIRDTAVRALGVLGMETGMSHCEWFRRRDGSIAISEIGARPPGAQFTTLISRAHDMDCLWAWVNLLVYETFDPPARRYAAGAAYLRGQGQGRVRAIHGLDQVERELGPLITDIKLPVMGQTPTGGYEGEGYIIVRHPKTATVRQALARLVDLVRVELAE